MAVLEVVSKCTVCFSRQLGLSAVMRYLDGSIALTGTGNEKIYPNLDGPIMNISTNFDANRTMWCQCS